jgi:thiol-disulfide isomerase/thioredoxin
MQKLIMLPKYFNYMTTIIVASSVMLLAMIFMANGRIDKGHEMGPSLLNATGWLNTQPLTLERLRGKIVLIDFWTYTCINWRRTLPYVREWASKYKDQGLVVIGVHTPEFSFEHKFENVNRAVHEMNINYPVAIDNASGIWLSFQNEYWPALYLIDADGQIRYKKFGEGDYQTIELQIQQLIKEVQPNNVTSQPVELHPTGIEMPADWGNLESPENYVGYIRTQGFASPQGVVADKRILYSAPGQLRLNQWGLSGEWFMGKENVFVPGRNGKIIYRFHARDLNLIMGPSVPESFIKFRVFIDGKAPGASHGLDVESNGNGTISEQRMYQLIRQGGPIIDREFTIEFLDPGAEAYDFTFG